MFELQILNVSVAAWCADCRCLARLTETYVDTLGSTTESCKSSAMAVWGVPRVALSAVAVGSVLPVVEVETCFFANSR